MAGLELTPEEFELHLEHLKQALTAYLERGEGDLRQLHKEAEDVLALVEQFPEVYERHRDVEGMVAGMLARERQQDVFGTDQPSESPGCTLGWLLPGRRQKG